MKSEKRKFLGGGKGPAEACVCEESSGEEKTEQNTWGGDARPIGEVFTLLLFVYFCLFGGLGSIPSTT